MADFINGRRAPHQHTAGPGGYGLIRHLRNRPWVAEKEGKNPMEKQTGTAFQKSSVFFKSILLAARQTPSIIDNLHCLVEVLLWCCRRGSRVPTNRKVSYNGKNETRHYNKTMELYWEKITLAEKQGKYTKASVVLQTGFSSTNKLKLDKRKLQWK